jgi:hypothetical protein
MGKYRSLGTLFNRVFRNDLNANFNAIAPHILSVLRSLSGNLTYPQMQEMYNSGIVEVCSHTMVHTKLDTTVSEERVDWELRASKELIRKIGFEPKVFVAPVSAYDKSGNKLNTLTSLYNAGYVEYKDATVTPASDICFKYPIDIYSLCRANVNCGVDKAKSSSIMQRPITHGLRSTATILARPAILRKPPSRRS